MSLLKSVTIVATILLLAFTFPLQVLSASQYLALAPYLALLLAFVLSRPRLTSFTGVAGGRYLAAGIYLFVVVVLGDVAWHVVTRRIGAYDAGLAVFVYAFPVLFFVYFRFLATDAEARLMLFAVAAAGLANGLWWAYDSYYKMLPGQIDSYSVKVYEYALARGASPEEARLWWLRPWQRSVGLLESFSVSAAWTAFGCFAALALVRSDRDIWRAVIVCTYGALLFAGQNVTALVSFSLVVLFVELRAHRLLAGTLPRQLSRFMATAAALLSALAVLWIYTSSETMEQVVRLIGSKIAYQVGLVTGDSHYRANVTYFGGLLHDAAMFFDTSAYSPANFIAGDFVTVAGRYGGDFGILDTAHILGLPLFFLTFIGLLRAVLSVLRHREEPRASDGEDFFGAMIILYVVAVEVHYGIWRAKSILPLLFIALALLDRSCASARQEEGLSKKWA